MSKPLKFFNLIVWLCLFLIISCQNRKTEEVSPAAESAQSGLNIRSHELSLNLIPDPFVVPLNNHQINLSDFPAQVGEQDIAVYFKINTSRLGRIEGENLEEKIYDLLVEHTPAPYRLQRLKSRESSEGVWGKLVVTLKRNVTRLKKSAKTMPTRQVHEFDFSLALSLPSPLNSNWKNWNFTYRDEQSPEENLAVNADFWQKLSEALPSIASFDEKKTNDWLKSLNLNLELTKPQASGAISLEEHQYFPELCVLTKTNNQNALLFLDRLDAAARSLSVDNILSLFCTKQATFIVSARSQRSLELTYQPIASQFAWKSKIPFDISYQNDSIHLLHNEELLCVYHSSSRGENKAFKIYCLNPKTGLPVWEARAQNASLRAITVYEQQLIVALEHSLYAFNPSGEIVYALKWEKPQAQARRSLAQFCVTGDILVFSPQTGVFFAFDLKNRQILWERASFGDAFLRCLPDETAIFSQGASHLVAISLRDFSPMWRLSAASTPLDAISYGGLLFILLKGAIYVVDPKTGNLRHQLGLNFTPNRFIQYNNRIFLDAKDKILELTKRYNY